MAKDGVVFEEPLEQASDLSKYLRYLVPLDEQLKLLRALNEHAEMPEEYRVSDGWFNINTESSHVQAPDDLEFLFVVKITLEETFRYNLKLIELAQPNVNLLNFAVDFQNLCLDSTALHGLYRSPGIQRLRINLMDNWIPDVGRSVDNLRSMIATSFRNKKLAAIEALGAYAVQNPELLQLQDGVNLPYVEMAGLRQGQFMTNTPCFRWGRHNAEVRIRVLPSANTHHHYAAPSMIPYEEDRFFY